MNCEKCDASLEDILFIRTVRLCEGAAESYLCLPCIRRFNEFIWNHPERIVQLEIHATLNYLESLSHTETVEEAAWSILEIRKAANTHELSRVIIAWLAEKTEVKE